MKLYALLTFLLALPLFVRLLPETADEPVSTPSSSETRTETAVPAASPVKAVEDHSPAALEKMPDTPNAAREHAH